MIFIFLDNNSLLMINWFTILIQYYFYYFRYQGLNFIYSMLENLKNQLETASNSFKTHNFKNALKQYNQCIQLVQQSQQSKDLLLNLYSSKAAVLSILQQNQEALQILNKALQQNPYHLACLTRRSQIYKKINKYKKAMKDLNIVSLFSPDNIHITAMKVEIQNLILKNPKTENQSQEEQQQLNEQEQLNFCNLKMIDKYSSHTIPQPNVKKSQGRMRVTITGDQTFQYRKQDDNNIVKRMSRQQISEKLTETLKQIKNQHLADEPIKDTALTISINRALNGKKSILKNRSSQLFVDLQQSKQNQETALTQSKLGQKVCNIDGKPIYAEANLEETNGSKEVQFRKSSYGSTDLIIKKKNNLRKSCLKNSSFASQLGKSNLVFSQLANSNHSNNQISQSNYSKFSKFSRLSRQSIDGTLLRKSVDEKKQDKVLQNQENECDSNDEGSQHNIYGSNQQLMSKQLRQNFGLDLESGNEKKKQKKERKMHKSILKNTSEMFTKSCITDDRKTKKSVMFKG